MAKALTSRQKEKPHSKNLTVKRTRLTTKRITSPCGKKKNLMAKRKRLKAKRKPQGKKRDSRQNFFDTVRIFKFLFLLP